MFKWPLLQIIILTFILPVFSVSFKLEKKTFSTSQTLYTLISGETLEEAGFAKFQNGQPSNSTPGEYCGAVYRNSEFNDVPCDAFFAFICEKSPHYPETCESDDLDRQANYTRICKSRVEEKEKSWAYQ